VYLDNLPVDKQVLFLLGGSPSSLGLPQCLGAGTEKKRIRDSVIVFLDRMWKRRSCILRELPPGENKEREHNEMKLHHADEKDAEDDDEKVFVHDDSILTASSLFHAQFSLPHLSPGAEGSVLGRQHLDTASFID